MVISVEKREALLNKAEELAKELSYAFKKIAPGKKFPGETELRIAFEFFISKKNFSEFKKLLQRNLPKRTAKTSKYWEEVRQQIFPFFSNRYSEEEFSYLLGWAIRLMRYKFLISQRSPQD
ncbi:MAG: hypothetical protein ACTSQE_14600 [Candidatus Heimdallarchaeaceae archaeon]